MSLTYPYSGPKVAIASGASLSASFAVGAGSLVALEIPAGWTPAVVTFQASVDNVTFFELYDDAGNEIKLTVASGSHVAIGEGTLAKAEHFRGAPYLKLRSGTAVLPVEQINAMSITAVILKTMGRLGV
jgi:hypothetical protein